MGLKENFAQAVRELTGANKEDKGEKKPPASDGLRRALDAPDDDARGKSILPDQQRPAANTDPAARRERRYVDAPVLFAPERREHMDVRPDAYDNAAQNVSFVSADHLAAEPILPIQPVQPVQQPIQPASSAQQVSAADGVLPFQPYQDGENFDMESDSQASNGEMNTNPFDFPSGQPGQQAGFNPPHAQTPPEQPSRNRQNPPPQTPAAQNPPQFNPEQAAYNPSPNANQQPPYRPSGQQGGYGGYAGRGFGGGTGNYGGGGFNNAGFNGGFVGRYGGYGSEEELTVISRNTVIDGNIRSFANMGIDGDIRGDVETTKNIELSGRIVGNLTCNNAQMHVSQVQGNIRMKGQVEMERDTLLIGDLMSTYARVNGKIKGNIDVAGKMELKSDSVVFGDISASTITVEDGAIIQGYVSTTFLSKEESRNIFPESVIIDT
jgi:cytoskeletal protein CcmA (bactofilin family)